MVLLMLAWLMAFVSVFSFVFGLVAYRRQPTLAEQLSSFDPRQGAEPRSAPPLVRDLDGTFRERVTAPVLARLGGVVQRLTPTGARDAMRLKVERAGNPGRMTAVHFVGLRATIAAIFIVLALGVYYEVEVVSGPLKLILVALVALVGWLLPDYWLQAQINARDRLISRALPDSIDVLVACAEAGLGLDQAISEVIKRRPGPLSDEFARLLKEINLGKTRVQAWQDLAARTGIDELRSFAAAVYQAEELGTSIAHVLRVQSDSTRTRRTLQIREMAAKLPVKMLFPLVFGIFPALFVVILGPAMVQIYRVLLPLFK